METSQTSARRGREYETIYILNPNLGPEETERVATRVTEVVAQRQGKLLRLDNWGRRRLAYPIAKQKRGLFIYLSYVGFNDLVAELERNLRMLDGVLRYQTVKLRDDVDPASIVVDPELLKFVHVESNDEDEGPGLEEQLGMVHRPGRGPMAPPEASESFEEDGVEDEASDEGLEV